MRFWERARARLLPDVEPVLVTVDMKRIYLALPEPLIDRLDDIAGDWVVSRRLLVEKVLTDFAKEQP